MFKRMMQLLAAGVAAAAIALTGAVVLESNGGGPEPRHAEASTYLGDYFGHAVYCRSKVIPIIRPTGSLRKYCTDAFFYVNRFVDGECQTWRQDGSAYLYTWGISFDIRGQAFVRFC